MEEKNKNQFTTKEKAIIIGIIILVLILIYITFVIIDCIRLKNSEFMTKPLITVDSSKGIEENGDSYTEYYRIRLWC